MSNKLIKKVFDKDIIDYYYLNMTIDQVVDKIKSLKIKTSNDTSIIPFFAQVRGYEAGIDSDNANWLIKKITEEEAFEHTLYELVYYIDFMMHTLSTPTALFKVDDQFYRASKVVLRSIQISSYNYLEEPFKKVLANDLINRWLFFDEDRNPNNYMVVQNSKRLPLIVAIDFNKSDLLTETMKISGDDKKFGWFRQEKTRYLTLLKPSNFENLSIDDFEDRLDLMMSMSEQKIKEICNTLFSGIIKTPETKTKLVLKNIITRRNYINEYFRKNFTSSKSKETKNKEENDKYEGLGQSFLKIYKEKK